MLQEITVEAGIDQVTRYSAVREFGCHDQEEAEEPDESDAEPGAGRSAQNQPVRRQWRSFTQAVAHARKSVALAKMKRLLRTWFHMKAQPVAISFASIRPVIRWDTHTYNMA